MEKAVDVAEKNMSRFGLSQAEISNRRKWVMQTRKKVSTLHAEASHSCPQYAFVHGQSPRAKVCVSLARTQTACRYLQLILHSVMPWQSVHSHCLLCLRSAV